MASKAEKDRRLYTDWYNSGCNDTVGEMQDYVRKHPGDIDRKKLLVFLIELLQV